MNWDLLISAGEAEGLRSDRLVRQGLYLTEAGLFGFAGGDAERWRIVRLVDPDGMGEELSVLVQSRGVEWAAARLPASREADAILRAELAGHPDAAKDPVLDEPRGPGAEARGPLSSTGPVAAPVRMTAGVSEGVARQSIP